MGKEIKLKPCPCGGEAKICISNENPYSETYVVKCMECGATSYPPSVFKSRAIKIWNEVER